ncbi:MAG TPA: multifunctional 2',3'-cyclic-nucleotide 2'-phosphodiesterase/5'-nucleotidase/3'-nucleotidase, partial [Methylovirgula sp.]
TGEELMAMLPDDPEGLLNKLKKAKPASEEPAPDSDTSPAPGATLTPGSPSQPPHVAAPATPSPGTSAPAPAPQNKD